MELLRSAAPTATRHNCQRQKHNGNEKQLRLSTSLLSFMFYKQVVIKTRTWEYLYKYRVVQQYLWIWIHNVLEKRGWFRTNNYNIHKVTKSRVPRKNTGFFKGFFLKLKRNSLMETSIQRSPVYLYINGHFWSISYTVKPMSCTMFHNNL